MRSRMTRWMLAMGLLLACAAESTAAAAKLATDEAHADVPVAMSVRTVGQYQGRWVVLLEDASGERRLPIWIGELEAFAIDLRYKKEKYPRPLTHDLLDATLKSLGARVERVDIVDLRDNVYYGRLTVRDAKGVAHAIDARPSDCIALAVGAGLPVFVAPRVLEAAGP
jgi:uncharacterized protein